MEEGRPHVGKDGYFGNLGSFCADADRKEGVPKYGNGMAGDEENIFY